MVPIGVSLILCLCVLGRGRGGGGASIRTSVVQVGVDPLEFCAAACDAFRYIHLKSSPDMHTLSSLFKSIPTHQCSA